MALLKLITKPEEINKNEPVLYMANRYIAVPEIDLDGAIRSINVTSLQSKGLIEIRGNRYLLKPCFYTEGGKEIKPERVIWEKELYYIPAFIFIFENFEVKARIYCDLYERGFVYQLESSKDIEVRFDFRPSTVNSLRFNTHKCYGMKRLFNDRWLKNPCISFDGYNFPSLAVALGGDEHFSCVFDEEEMKVNCDLELTASLKLRANRKNGLYFTLNADPDGASATLIHLRRKGLDRIYEEFTQFLKERLIVSKDKEIEKILNENLFFNYFFSTSADFYSDKLVAMTSRSKRYYVSGAFWERDCFLWSLPAIKLCDREFYQRLYRELLLTHHKNAGNHAHYIDGTVLYPGFELDEACSYFIDLDFSDSFFDDEVLKAFDCIVERIEKEFDEETGLYRTFLLPSDDPADHEFVLIDNVLLLKGYKNLIRIYRRLGKPVDILENRVKTLKENIGRFIKEVDGKRIYAWSIDKEGNFRLYNDPPGNLGTLVFYGLPFDEVFKNTIEYYYSPRYGYYDKCSRFKELACDHHPDTPSGLGLCGSLLNPLRRDDALFIVRNAPFDNGILCESFDKNTGEVRTGAGFATGAGYLAFALYKAVVEGEGNGCKSLRSSDQA